MAVESPGKRIMPKLLFHNRSQATKAFAEIHRITVQIDLRHRRIGAKQVIHDSSSTNWPISARSECAIPWISMPLGKLNATLKRRRGADLLFAYSAPT